MTTRAAAFLLSACLCAGAVPAFGQWTPQSTVVLKGKIVTLDGNKPVVDGLVVIKGGKVTEILPANAPIPSGALVVDSKGYIYPGLMDLHNHIAYNFLKLYEITGKPGRPGHTTNHDQWPSGDDYAREVNNPNGVVNDFYGFIAESQKFAEVRAMIGGATSLQGEDPKGRGPIQTTLVRNVNLDNFGISDQQLGVGQNALGFSGMDFKAFGERTAAEVAQGLPVGKAGADWRKNKQRPKAFLLHLAEGIDAVARREYIDESFDLNLPIQTTLSREVTIEETTLLTALATTYRTTVDQLKRLNKPRLDSATSVFAGTKIKVPAKKNQPGVGNLVKINGKNVPFMVWPGLVGVHATALNEGDFKMWQSHLKTLGATGTAAQPKIVWSPLSNLLLYGDTTDLKAARAANALIAMGTDWSPSGNKNMLWELKTADEVNTNKFGKFFSRRELIEMATVNGAKMLGWENLCGRVAPGLFADLLVVDAMPGAKDAYDNLIMAGEGNIQLVLVGGDPLYGDKAHLDNLKVYQGRPRYELLPESGTARPKGIDMMQDPSASNMTLQQVKDRLAEGLRLDPAEMAARVNAPGNGGARKAVNDKLGRGKVETPVSVEDIEKFLKVKYPYLKPIEGLETLYTDEEFLAAVGRNVHWNDPAKYPLPASLNLRQHLTPIDPTVGAAEVLESSSTDGQ